MKKGFPSFLIPAHPLDTNFYDQVRLGEDIKSQKEHQFEIVFPHLQFYLIRLHLLAPYLENRKKQMEMKYLLQKNNAVDPLNIDLLHRVLQFANRVQ